MEAGLPHPRTRRRWLALGAAVALWLLALVGTWHHHEGAEAGHGVCQVCVAATGGTTPPAVEVAGAAPALASRSIPEMATAPGDAGHVRPTSARAPPALANS